MDDLGRLQGRYPENFMLISRLEVCQEGGSRRGILGFLLRVPDQDMVILDVMSDIQTNRAGRFPITDVRTPTCSASSEN